MELRRLTIGDREAITRLTELAPDTALLVDENGQWEVPASMLKPGDNILVKASHSLNFSRIVDYLNP